MARSPFIPRDTITALLASALGQEKAEAVVVTEAHRLGFPSEGFDLAQVLTLLDALGETEGLIGVAARFAKARGNFAREEPPSEPSPLGPRSVRMRAVSADSMDADAPSSRRHPAPLGSGDRSAPANTRHPPVSAHSRASGSLPMLSTAARALGDLLTPRLGMQTAWEAIQGHATLLHFQVESLSRDEAIQVLESMKGAEGHVGTVARFATARFLLRFPA